MARGKAYRFARFARGLNTADGPYGLREGYDNDPSGLGSEARALLNVTSRHRGNVSRRDGCVSLFESPDTAGELFKDISVIDNGGGSFALASTDAGVLYAIDTGLTRTQLATGLSTDAPWTFLGLPEITTQGRAYGMNGTDTPRETDGTLAGTGNWTAVTGTLPNGTLLEYHDNELWIAGVASAPYSLYWSNLGDPTDWPADNVTKFNPDGGLPLTALRSVGPYLLVFKERGIWSVYNAETSANRKFADGAGTLSPRSVVATPLGCFFLDPQQGVMLTDGNDVKRVSTQIQPLLDQITAPDLPSVTGAFHNGHYYLAASFNGVRKVLDYDAELGSWWVHSPPMAALATWDRGTTLDLVGVSGDAGEAWHLFKADELSDPSGVFESYWSGPFHTFGAPHLRKRCRQVHIDGRGLVDVYAATDYDPTHGAVEGQGSFSAAGDGGIFGGAGTFGDPAGVFGGGGGVGEDSLYSLGVGRSWSMTFYSAYEGYWELDAYTMLMDKRNA